MASFTEVVSLGRSKGMVRLLLGPGRYRSGLFREVKMNQVAIGTW